MRLLNNYVTEIQLVNSILKKEMDSNNVRVFVKTWFWGVKDIKKKKDQRKCSGYRETMWKVASHGDPWRPFLHLHSLYYEGKSKSQHYSCVFSIFTCEGRCGTAEAVSTPAILEIGIETMGSDNRDMGVKETDRISGITFWGDGHSITNHTAHYSVVKVSRVLSCPSSGRFSKVSFSSQAVPSSKKPGC